MRYVFPDTSLFMHYRSVDQIPWSTILGDESVELIIAAPVLRELEQHKDQQRDTKLRKRARETVSRLHRWVLDGTSAEIGTRLVLRVIPKDATIDYAAHGLNPSIPDDQIIAAMIEFSSDNSLAREAIAIAAGDYLMRHKARGHGFSVASLSEELRLPDIPTDEEARLKELESENRALTSRLPRIRVGFVGTNGVLRVQLIRPVKRTHDEKAALLAEKRSEHPRHSEQTERDPSDPTFVRFAAAQIETQRKFMQQAMGEYELSVDEYNSRLEEYFEDYAQWLDRLDDHASTQARSVTLALEVRNDGTAPASNLDVAITLAVSGVRFYKKGDKALRGPHEPMPPEPVERTARQRDFLMPHGLITQVPVVPSLSINPSVTIRGDRITVWTRKLKQAQRIAIPPVVLLWADEASPVTLLYTVNTEELPTEFSDKLTILPELVGAGA